MIRTLIKNKYLLGQLTKKDIELKYKDSVLGMLWSVLVPIFMIVIYTFVFSVVFRPQWISETGSRFEFALMMYCGLAAFNMVSDVMGRSAGLIAANVNYVKKVIFPLELLPVMVTLTALFNSCINLAVLVAAKLVLTQSISVTLPFVIIVYIPLLVFTAGVSLVLSAVSVYLKDIASVISVAITVLMYVSPVFYSLESVPNPYRIICGINPLTYMIENFRNVVLYGVMPNWTFLAISCLAAVIMAWLGSIIFRRAKEGFADVL